MLSSLLLEDMKGSRVVDFGKLIASHEVRGPRLEPINTRCCSLGLACGDISFALSYESYMYDLRVYSITRDIPDYSKTFQLSRISPNTWNIFDQWRFSQLLGM